MEDGQGEVRLQITILRLKYVLPTKVKFEFENCSTRGE